MPRTPADQAIRFFTRLPLTQALFTWIEFRLFVTQHKPLKNTPAGSESWQVEQWLTLWKESNPVASVASFSRLVFFLFSAISGALAMTGLLTLTVHQPINVWWPLCLFAGIPLLMSALVLIRRVLFAGRSTLVPGPTQQWLLVKLRLNQYRDYYRLLLPWVSWQWQLGGVAFLLSALLTFLVMATFQDVTFYWSSTFIKEPETMKRVFDVIAWPWHNFVEPPGLESLQASQFVMDATVSSPKVGGNLWSFVLMSIVTYGLLPRLFISGWQLWLTRKTLVQNIASASDIEQFLVLQQHRETVNPLTSNTAQTGPLEIVLLPNEQDIIVWQQTNARIPTIQVLGVATWEDDVHWLQSAQAKRTKPVVVLVNSWSTPTGELADVMDLLKKQNSDVSLVLHRADERNRQTETHLKSWQHFAERYQVTIKLEVPSHAS